MRNWWKDFAVSDKLFKFHLGKSTDDENRWHMNDIYFFCYKNLLVTDRSVVKPTKTLLTLLSSKNRFQRSLLTYVRRLNSRYKAKIKG